MNGGEGIVNPPGEDGDTLGGGCFGRLLSKDEKWSLAPGMKRDKRQNMRGDNSLLFAVKHLVDTQHSGSLCQSCN